MRIQAFSCALIALQNRYKKQTKRICFIKTIFRFKDTIRLSVSASSFYVIFTAQFVCYMKLVSYLTDGRDQLAFLVDGLLYDCDLLHPELPNSMNMFLHYWDDMFPVAQQVEAAIKSGRISKEQGVAIDTIDLLAPVPFPTSCRDGYAFRQHVAAARRNRK